MPLTNAERQARHRERIKDKLRNAPELRNGSGTRESGLAEADEMLRNAYYSVAEQYFARAGERAREAIEAFLSEEIGFADIMLMVMEQAYGRINDHYECGNVGVPVREMSWRKHAKTIAERVT
ncbi:hypothetical protein [Rhizobium sp. OAE497]|uniref:hypothetical protein n=1 Tax=Rhizobium sp. OAE497 TaxID=2663796 RepID=UPI0018F4A5EA